MSEKADGWKVRRKDWPADTWHWMTVKPDWADEAIPLVLAAPACAAPVVEMALCEINRLVLKEGVTYRFKRMHQCKSCQDYAEAVPVAATPDFQAGLEAAAKVCEAAIEELNITDAVVKADDYFKGFRAAIDSRARAIRSLLQKP